MSMLNKRNLEQHAPAGMVGEAYRKRIGTAELVHVGYGRDLPDLARNSVGPAQSRVVAALAQVAVSSFLMLSRGSSNTQGSSNLASGRNFTI